MVGGEWVGEESAEEALLHSAKVELAVASRRVLDALVYFTKHASPKKQLSCS